MIAASDRIEFMPRIKHHVNAKVNDACNNILFNREKMHPMHSSMAKLYQCLHDKFGLSGPAALARKLNESTQTVKNWETRGLSEGGALKAQAVYAVDANWLLGDATEKTLPFTYSTGGSVVKMPAKEIDGGWMWPFRAVSPDAYALLSQEEKDHLENGILLCVKNRGSPTNQRGPANKIATG